jgi:predicted nucleotidyltransferase
MISLIAQKQDEIAAHCRRLDVRRLEVFGSAARGTFDPETSDLDFLVDFNDRRIPGIADRYFDLADSLEALFNRKVDLIEHPVSKPRVRANIEREKELVYGLP